MDWIECEKDSIGRLVIEEMADINDAPKMPGVVVPHDLNPR